MTLDLHSAEGAVVVVMLLCWQKCIMSIHRGSFVSIGVVVEGVEGTMEYMLRVKGGLGY